MSSTVDAASGSGRSGRREVLPTLIPILLAALGLTRPDRLAGGRRDQRGGHRQSRRPRRGEGQERGDGRQRDRTTRTLEAFLDYERARRRAAALAAADLGDEAQLDRMIATAHWFLVNATFIDRDGNFQPDAQRQALMADAVQDADLDPAPHFATADRAWITLSSLILSAIVVALALPFLTLAQVTTGRLRVAGTLIGSVTLAAGIALMAMA